ncbi:MAG: VOC family protein [Prosthecobacter sp.]|nr:VOC family protein [Prosthecobacter sp.]
MQLNPRLVKKAIQTQRVVEGFVMHKSRLAGFIIDCRTDNLQGAASFWGEALGMEVRQLPPAEAEKYVELVDPGQRLHVEVQAVTHPSRVHLDIETDNIEAEVQRLEALGAKRIEQVGTWWVMEAPTGQRFCVVRGVSPGFASEAREWP